MRHTLLIYFLLVLPLALTGQTQRGTVTDAETLQPLYQALIVNQATQQSTSTDENGNFSILARTGDAITIAYAGYHAIEQKATPGTPLKIGLKQLNVKLKEYVVHDLTPFQRDSIAMTQLYEHELKWKPVKVGFSNANGGGITGLIGAPVQRLSRSYKQNKRFKENFRRDMEQKYIDTRYTPALVISLTSLSGEHVAEFMNAYPMDYVFARTASDLEMKAWIRNNYKQYIGSVKRR